MLQNHNTIVNALTQFANNNLSLRRFKVSFFEQFDNFSTSGDSFPILYAIPNEVSFEENIDVQSFRVYCVDILQKDRSNEQYLLNDTLLVLRDLTNWLREGDNGLNILNIPRAIPVNNFLVDFTCGWYIDIDIECEAITTDCAIPFSSNFVLTGTTCDIGYVSQYLTCETLIECQGYIDLGNEITNIYTILSGLTGQTTYQYWTSGSTGTHSIKANNNSGLDATGDYAVAIGGNTLASGNTSFAGGSGTTAASDISFAFGLNSIASASEIVTVITTLPKTVVSGCSITLSDPNNSLPAVVLSGDVTTEWSDYYFTYCSLFTLFSGSSSNMTIDCSTYYDMYYDFGTDSTYIVDLTISDNTFTEISGDTFYNVVSYDTVSRPAFAIGSNVKALGVNSFAEGSNTTASGITSHAEGTNTTASGIYSHSEGNSTIASGDISHAEGDHTTASGLNSHAEGAYNLASGLYSHAEGGGTTAGDYSHAEGIATKAIGNHSHSEGRATIASGYASHSEGDETTAGGNWSSTKGQYTKALGMWSFAGGRNSTASGDTSFVYGSGSTANGIGVIVLGNGITGSSLNTTYVNKLNIKNVPTGTTLNNLGIDSNGNVIIGSTGGTPTLNQVLIAGNTASTQNIVMGSTKVIKSSNGGGELGLDGGSYGLLNTVYLTNDNNGFGKSYLSFDENLYGYNNYVSLAANDTSTNTIKGSINIGVYSSNVTAYKALLKLDSNYTSLLYKTADINLTDAQINLNAATSIFSGVLRITPNTANTLAYHDASKNIKSASLGSNLVLTSGVLNTSPTLTATSISATTYLNLPTDVNITGGTYSNGTTTFTNNTGGTFSVTGLTINKFSYTDASNGITSVSNSNTLSKSVLIPANTLTNGALNIKGRSQKSGTGSFAWLVIYVNTTNSLSGASEIGRINNASNNTILCFSIDRTIPIKVGSFTAFIINAITGYEEAITNNVSTVTIDWTVDQYIILAVQANGGALPSESLVANFLSVNQF